MNGRYFGSWTLPSGNSCDAYLEGDWIKLYWDRAPSPGWPTTDVEFYRNVTSTEILRAASAILGKPTAAIVRVEI